jgi:hypothetical protein
MVDSASEARLRAEARAKSTASAKTRETKTDAQKDAELGISRGRTDSAASVDERTQLQAKKVIPTSPVVFGTEEATEAAAAGEAALAEAELAVKEAERGEELAEKLAKIQSGEIVPIEETEETDKGMTPEEVNNILAEFYAKIQEDALTQKRKASESAYSLLYDQFSRMGLGSLVQPLQRFIQDGISDAEFTIRLRETDAYKKRFAANEQRIKKGFAALSEADYLDLEDRYQGVMRQYGLPESYYQRGELGRQEGFEKLLAADVRDDELADRLNVAYNRVINAAPEIKESLKQFYPDITNGDILAYTLDPEKAILDIKRKVTSAEIGAGAMQAGLKTGVARAEELQRYGVTKETAQQGFGTIASGLERGRQLSNIYQQPTYTQEVAETEVFALPDADKARRQRRKLGQLETATFSGSTGMTGGALDRERAGQY